ncbi:RNHCP domain-containing protein [Candidatus Peregrinibacteria bacterium]|nr:MAG: RNHCP domain-containing protein [Candidatus Peregrinibacteria bacterium]
MAFYKKNEGFLCEYCGAKNSPAEKTCRNHCRICLASKHVDIDPGDRKNLCGGKMIPVGILSGNKKADFVFLYKCEYCGVERKNRSAPDDCFEAILKISQKTFFS